MDLFQMTMPAHAYDYGTRSSGETHGVVLTKRHIVELILDLAGYDAEIDLGANQLLEPACGHGAFLVPAVERLLLSAQRARRPIQSLGSAIRAFDIDPTYVVRSREAVTTVLTSHGVAGADALRLARTWVSEADFLLAPLKPAFHYVVGNPPYVRIEQLSAQLQAEYRRCYRTLYDRADLYVAFIERGLDLLPAGGRLSFICADRWTVNRYGGPLRRKITGEFALKSYLDLHKASPFHSDVIAYPSIFTVERGPKSAVTMASLDSGSETEVATLRTKLRGNNLPARNDWHSGSDPWIVTPPKHIAALRNLERRFGTLEATPATRVRIGVATGADDIFIVNSDADVEDDRLVPLVMRDDVKNGRILQASQCVLNTFDDAGRLVDLRRYPRLRRYFTAHQDRLNARHVAKRNPKAWFRTIDRVYPSLVTTSKLLIPDIAGSNEVVFESGRFHPHHNLYYVTSASWDLEVLGALLSSKVALFFVWSYAPKMRGGYLRFQAQYLRRIRTPRPDQISGGLATKLRAAFRNRDFASIDALALQAYRVESIPSFDFTDTRA